MISLSEAARKSTTALLFCMITLTGVTACGIADNEPKENIEESNLVIGACPAYVIHAGSSDKSYDPYLIAAIVSNCNKCRAFFWKEDEKSYAELTDDQKQLIKITHDLIKIDRLQSQANFIKMGLNQDHGFKFPTATHDSKNPSNN